jgi:hypothetical protein
MLMNRAYWRSPEAYKKLETFDAPGFAFQFLNRNPEFVKDRERLQQMDRRGALEPAEVKAFARRWGLLLPDDKSSK